ncbi:hypothetical protein VLK31_31640 [Variovorax sp. H27-G14]|uniref:hypothetical protein n=1 Tax=Variovorax sp. H27-G14 TaxID=3111914 RepID=UPI0038FCE084
MNLLRTLAQAPMPCMAADPVQIDRLRVLQAAGLVDAHIPQPRRDGLTQDPAAVHAITPRGWKVLRTNRIDAELSQAPGTQRVRPAAGERSHRTG